MGYIVNAWLELGAKKHDIVSGLLFDCEGLSFSEFQTGVL